MSSPFVFPDAPWPAIPGVTHGHDLSVFIRPVSLPMPDGSTYSATIFDLSSDMQEVDGRLGLAESCARRLVTFGGSLIDDPDYGRDLRLWLNEDVQAGSRTLAVIATSTQQEMLKDERVVTCSAKATFLNGILTVSVSLFDTKGPFKLTLTVDQVTVAVLLSGVT